MIEKFLGFIKANHLFHAKEPLLLAVSGGIDSTVMGHLFSKSNMIFGIAHINFRLRGKDADEDELFVASLAHQFKVPFFVTHFETEKYAADKKISVQMAARELRYDWLEKTRIENHYHFIATAHHQNDAVETVLLNMFRGTGIHGLHGIHAKQGKVVRPMLPFFKEEIENYAITEKISFRQDLSNFETDYDRNKIRLQIIPVIEKFFPAFQKTFAENIPRWEDAGWLYEQMVFQLKKKLMTKKGEEFYISIPKLNQYPPAKTLLFELLKEFNFSGDQTQQIITSFDSIPGKIFYSPTHRLLKDRKQLIISQNTTEAISEMLITEDDRLVNTASFKLKISVAEAMNFPIPKDSSFSCLDLNELEFPLLLRKWKKGDYFYPFGMRKKKKKISDYLIDRKIPMNEKENIWVIESGKRITCIIGERIDERFRITSSTKNIFVIRKMD